MAGNDLEKAQVSVEEAPPLGGGAAPAGSGSRKTEIWVWDAAAELELRQNLETKVPGYVV